MNLRKSMRSSLSATIALVGSWWCFTPGTALAQSSANSAAAQGLFDEAKALMAAGNAKEACPKFEESQRLDPGSGTLVNLAKCYEDTGRIASAWSTYLEAASAAKTSGNAERESGARAQAAALAPRVSKLVIKVDPTARVDGLEVLRDGTSVGSAEWGVPIPADEGEHTLLARAPGHREWKSVAVVKGEGAKLEVIVPKLEAEAAVTPLTTASGPTSSEPPPPESSGLGTQKILALTAGGVGVVGLAVGTVFGLKAMSKKSDADAACTDTTCANSAAAEAGNDAHSAGNIATIGMVVGVVGLAGGLALWFTAPKEEGPTAQVRVGLGSVQVRGAW